MFFCASKLLFLSLRMETHFQCIDTLFIIYYWLDQDGVLAHVYVAILLGNFSGSLGVYALHTHTHRHLRTEKGEQYLCAALTFFSFPTGCVDFSSLFRSTSNPSGQFLLDNRFYPLPLVRTVGKLIANESLVPVTSGRRGWKFVFTKI